MYTTRTTELGKLKSYYNELTDLYHAALDQRHFEKARAIRDRRVRVKRAILLREEWAPSGVPTLDYDELLTSGR